MLERGFVFWCGGFATGRVWRRTGSAVSVISRYARLQSGGLLWRWVTLIAEFIEPSCFALPGRVTFANRGKSNPKRLPHYPARLRRVPSLRLAYAGPRRRAIPSPSPLAPHPCGLPHYSQPTLSRIKGAIGASRTVCLPLPLGEGWGEGKTNKQTSSQMCKPPNHRPSPMPPPAGRVEGCWKRLSGRDAAQSPMGHGWPFGLGLWRQSGARELGVAEPMLGACFLCLLFFRKE